MQHMEGFFLFVRGTARDGVGLETDQQFLQYRD